MSHWGLLMSTVFGIDSSNLADPTGDFFLNASKFSIDRSYLSSQCFFEGCMGAVINRFSHTMLKN